MKPYLRITNKALVLCLTLVLLTSVAQAQTVDLTLPNPTVAPGDTLTLDLMIDCPALCTAAQLVLTYPTESLQVTDVRSTKFMESAGGTAIDFTRDFDTPGVIEYEVANFGGGGQGSGSLLEIDLTIADDAATGPAQIAFTTSDVRDADTAPFPVNVSGGLIQIDGADDPGIPIDTLKPTDYAEVRLTLLDGNNIAGVQLDETFAVRIDVVDTRDSQNPQGVYSAYFDMRFDPARLRAESITRATNYQTLPRGTIDNTNGIIDDLGGSSSNTSPSTETYVATVTFTAISVGDATVATATSGLPAFGITLYGVDTNVTEDTFYGFINNLTIVEGTPDLRGAGLDITPHALNGLVDVTITVANNGEVPTGPFAVDVLLADTDACNVINPDDVVATANFTGVAALDSATITVTDVQLPKDVLNGRALAEDVPNQGDDTVSQNRDYLCLQIDPQNTVVEEDEGNNSGLGLGIDSQHFAYFPWDRDGDGQVSPLDAIAVINRLGAMLPPAPGTPVDEIEKLETSDMDGDNMITPLDAVRVINRLGYLAHPDFALAALNAWDGVSASAAWPMPVARVPRTAQMDLQVVELDTVPGLLPGEAFNLELYLRDSNLRPAFAAELDLAFDPTHFSAQAVRYGANYGALQAANMGVGIVDGLNVVNRRLAPAADAGALLATVRMVARAAGTSSIVAEPSGRVVVYGSDFDVSHTIGTHGVRITVQTPAQPALPIPTQRGTGVPAALPIAPADASPEPTPLPALPIEAGR